jgi:hypothetical protein
MVVNIEQLRYWKDMVVVAKPYVTPRHYPEEGENNHENPQSG